MFCFIAVPKLKIQIRSRDVLNSSATKNESKLGRLRVSLRSVTSAMVVRIWQIVADHCGSVMTAKELKDGESFARVDEESAFKP